MPDRIDEAIDRATTDPKAAELVRASRRFEELRGSTAWNELRELLKGRRERVTFLLGQKALRGTAGSQLRDEGLYSRGFLDGMEFLLERPSEIEQRLEALISASYEEIRREQFEIATERSPYAS
jgi:hypothetical protein